MPDRKITRNMHFLSQFYLAGFTDSGTKEGNLYAFDVGNGKMFRPKPKAVAVERDFNKIELEGYAPDFLEKELGVFEGKAASVISAIRQNGFLPPDHELAYIINLICLFVVHHPVTRGIMSGVLVQTAKIIESMLISDKRIYEHHLQKAYKAGFINKTEVDFPFEQMKESVEKGDYKIEIPTNTSLSIEFGVFKQCLSTFGSRHWSLLIASPEASDFITCDRPVTVAFKEPSIAVPQGYGLLKTELVFPIGSRHALLGVYEDPLPQEIVLISEKVAELNTRIINNANRQIYSRDSTVDIVKDGKMVNLLLCNENRL